MEKLKDHFVSCIIGQALGDAMGFPVEGQTPEICRQYIENLLIMGPGNGYVRGQYEFGQYSDDTQLAREMMISYLERGQFDPADYARRISDIFAEGLVVGPGRTTSTAAQNLQRGIAWNLSAVPSPAAGNGSAMRAAPVGLFFYDNPGKLIQASHDQSRITHADIRCSAGSVAIAGAVSLVLNQETFELDPFLNQLSLWVELFDEFFAETILKLKEWIDFPPDTAIIPISRSGVEQSRFNKHRGVSTFVVSSVLWSLYSFLRSPDDFAETMKTAISAGGDVDTTAAMAGAISGAFLGMKGIPMELARKINDNGAWDFDALVLLAEKCFELKTAARV